MKLNLTLRRFVLGVTAICAVVFSACEPEALKTEDGFALHYPAVSEIAPGTILEVPPTWYGGKPVEFALGTITLDGEVVPGDCFSVNPETGAVKINTQESDPVGNYVIGITCKVDGKVYDFPNAICLELMKPVPDGIVVEPAEISAKLRCWSGVSANLKRAINSLTARSLRSISKPGAAERTACKRSISAAY